MDFYGDRNILNDLIFLQQAVKVTVLTYPPKQKCISRDSPVRFSFHFLAYMDRPSPEDEPFSVFKLFCGFLDFSSYVKFSVQIKGFRSGKILFFQNFLLIGANLFGNFSNHQNHFVNLFLNHNSVFESLY
jgi:hypothetical protein